jgi:hypothetical protein
MADSVNLEIINDEGYGEWWDNTVIYKIQFIDHASTESNVSAGHLRVLRAILFVFFVSPRLCSQGVHKEHKENITTNTK